MLLILVLFIISGQSEYKSLTTARLYSALLPGAGQFYVHNYLEGSLDLVITGGLLAGALLSFNAVDDAPTQEQAAEGEFSKEDLRILGWTFGISAFGYYLWQIWKLNDDVVVYNYKKRFIESASLKLNFNSSQYSILLTKSF